MMIHNHYRYLGVLLASCVATHGLSADDSFFETRIRPVFADHCYSCHGPDRQKANMRLDTAKGFLRGGDSGRPLVVPGKPAESLLIQAVRQTSQDDVPAMPPKGKLTDRQIADIEQWITSGARYPETPEVNPSAGHWAFQSMAHPEPPKVKDARWATSPIDQFILARLEAEGLTPAPAANKHTWLRRVNYDLTGLPPTTEEITNYLNDKSPDADRKVVDRLLATPAYGERWGRHWLDVVRYADSNGLDENIAMGTAWRYRDYVVNAFNTDKPYNQFLLEQLAGDLLPASSQAQQHEQWIATGFLSLGPKVLAEPDKRKMELDIVDEQIDTLGRAFIGLTLGCARCHDHKFDPITTEDYYALVGIFTSTHTMDSFKTIARWHEHSLASPHEHLQKIWHDKKLARVKNRVKALTGKTDEDSKAELAKAKARQAELEKASRELPSAIGVKEGKVTDSPLLRRGNYLTAGDVVPRRFPGFLTNGKQEPLPPDQSGRLQLAQWIIAPDHPLTARVAVNRIWRWHFGRGISTAVDNFGLLGEAPTHPELLDWLAQRFIASGWSIKAMHREILLSATYRQSAQASPEALKIDPSNQLYSRTMLRRLEVEAIRDAMLTVSGQLDRTMGGPAITHVKNREFLFDHTSKDGTTYDSVRRSLYLPVIRNNLYPVFQLFDAPDPAVPNGDRTTTTVATQALFALNSDIIMTASEKIAASLLAKLGDDTQRIQSLYLLAYGRPATKSDILLAQQSISVFEKELEAEPATERRQQAWMLYCQAILGSNEFVYLH